MLYKVLLVFGIQLIVVFGVQKIYLVQDFLGYFVGYVYLLGVVYFSSVYYKFLAFENKFGLKVVLAFLLSLIAFVICGVLNKLV